MGDGVVTICRKEAAAASAATVMANGETITLEQLVAGTVTIEPGVFIAGCKKETKAGLLQRMKNDMNGWEPENPMSDMMPMFIDKMDQEKIMWLLRQAEVEYVEADGVVSICKK